MVWTEAQINIRYSQQPGHPLRHSRRTGRNGGNVYSRSTKKKGGIGPKHMSTLHSVNNIGILKNDEGELAEAEAIYKQILQGKEEAFGLKHISTLNTVII